MVAKVVCTVQTEFATCYCSIVYRFANLQTVANGS